MTETNIERMYRAGKVDIPAHADLVARVGADFHTALATFDEQAALAGDPAFLCTLLDVGGTTHNSFRSTVGTLNDCATAVLSSAEHYVQTDADAAADLARMDPSLRDRPAPSPADLPPDLADPGAPGAVEADGTEVDSTPAPTDAATDARQRETKEETSRWITSGRW